jgi:DNA-binding IclR family transcriptional regulator
MRQTANRKISEESSYDGRSVMGGKTGKAQATKRDALKPTGTQSIQRAALLLREIAAHNRFGLRLVDLATRSNLERPTVHRILKSLVAENMVAQSPGNRHYFLGQALFEFGLAAAQQFSLRDLCQASLNRIAEKTGDTVFLTVRSGAEAVCIDRKDGAYPIKVFTLNIGDRRPLGVGAGGLAILSALPPQHIQEIVSDNTPRLATHSSLSAAVMMTHVRQTQELGYSLHDVRSVSGVKAIGVAIRNKTGEPFAALSISALSDRMIGKRCKELVALLKSEARVIEKLINQQADVVPQSLAARSK